MLNEQLDTLIMGAMKEHNAVKTRTFRAIKTAFMEARTAKGAGEFTEETELKVLQKMVKQREDAIVEYKAGNREDLAVSEQEEMDIIRTFLPAPVGETEITTLFWNLTKQIEPTAKNMGLFIKNIKSAYPTVDGKLVAGIVKSNLC